MGVEAQLRAMISLRYCGTSSGKSGRSTIMDWTSADASPSVEKKMPEVHMDIVGCDPPECHPKLVYVAFGSHVYQPVTDILLTLPGLSLIFRYSGGRNPGSLSFAHVLLRNFPSNARSSESYRHR